MTKINETSSSYYGYVYKTTVPATETTPYERFYIGKHAGRFDPKYHGSGKAIRDWMKKHGKGRLVTVVLEYASSYEGLNALEKKYVAECLGTEGCMNLTEGGQGGEGHESKENAKELLSKGRLGTKQCYKFENGEKRVRSKLSPEDYREALEEGWSPGMGPRSDETRKKMSDSAKFRVLRDGPPKRTLGKRYVTNGVESKQVIDPSSWIENGWWFGRTILYKVKNGFVGMNDGVTNKKVSLEKYNFYLESGWKRGYVRSFK